MALSEASLLGLVKQHRVDCELVRGGHDGRWARDEGVRQSQTPGVEQSVSTPSVDPRSSPARRGHTVRRRHRLRRGARCHQRLRVGQVKNNTLIVANDTTVTTIVIKLSTFPASARHSHHR